MNKNLIKSEVLFIIIPILYLLINYLGILVFRNFGVNEMGISNVLIPKLFLDFLLYFLLGYLVIFFYKRIDLNSYKIIKIIFLFYILLVVLLYFLSISENNYVISNISMNILTRLLNTFGITCGLLSIAFFKSKLN